MGIDLVLNTTDCYLGETRILDFYSSQIVRLVTMRSRKSLSEFERVGVTCEIVHNDVALGRNFLEWCSGFPRGEGRVWAMQYPF